MISKLESAGLGFYVRMNETLDKLGQLSLKLSIFELLFENYVHVISSYRINSSSPVSLPSTGPSSKYETVGL